MVAGGGDGGGAGEGCDVVRGGAARGARWGAGANVQDITGNLNVDNLCRAVPRRVQELDDKGRDRSARKHRRCQFCPGDAHRAVGETARVRHAFLSGVRSLCKKR